MIYVSSSSINNSSIESSINELIKLNIRNIELSGGTNHSENIASTLKKLKDKFSLNFLIHNYFPPPREDFVLNIASFNDKTRRRSIDFIKASVDLAHEIGIGYYSVHAGYRKHFDPGTEGGYFVPDDSQNISYDHALTIIHESIFEIMDHAKKYNVSIGIENLFPHIDSPDSSLLCTPDEIFKFLDTVTYNAGAILLLDLGHLCISANHFNFDKDKFLNTLLKKYHFRISWIHISGNDGITDKHGPLSPDCWQLKAAQRFNLKKIPVTLECRSLKAEEISNQYQMVKHILEGNIQQCCTT